jgi:hypothetical protein
MTHIPNDNSRDDSETGQPNTARVLILGALLLILITIISIAIVVGLRASKESDTPSALELEQESNRLQATSSAACAQFISDHPGTPCPPMTDPNFSATATQACSDYVKLFPGTPCPD